MKGTFSTYCEIRYPDVRGIYADLEKPSILRRGDKQVCEVKTQVADLFVVVSTSPRKREALSS